MNDENSWVEYGRKIEREEIVKELSFELDGSWDQKYVKLFESAMGRIVARIKERGEKKAREECPHCDGAGIRNWATVCPYCHGEGEKKPGKIEKLGEDPFDLMKSPWDEGFRKINELIDAVNEMRGKA